MPPPDGPTPRTRPELPPAEAEFHRRHTPTTDPGPEGRAMLAGLPSDPLGLAQVVRGLVAHREEQDRFGARFAEHRMHHDAETRYTAQILRLLAERSAAPLTERRAPGDRFIGTCRDFAVLHTSLLREAGVPARVRVGTVGYFVPGERTHHWVTQYWDDRLGWRLLDPQLAFPPGEDGYRVPFDAPHPGPDDFRTGGAGWLLARAGTPDAARDVLVNDLLLDLAALTGTHLLPWDLWGPVRIPEHQPLDDALTARLDRAAAATADPAATATAADLHRLHHEPDLAPPTRVTSDRVHLGPTEVQVADARS